MVINVFGVFVYVLCLYYVEFFGMFYLGEGKRFEFFKFKREVLKFEFEV